MAYITGEFQHQQREIKIEVLQPTNDENDFEDGMKVNVDWENMQDFKTSEVKEICKWISDTMDIIDRDFNKDGSCNPVQDSKEDVSGVSNYFDLEHAAAMERKYQERKQ